MPSSHAKLSASSSARWLNCPGSVKVIEQYEDKGSAFAQEGTAAHQLAELCLVNDRDPKHYLGQSLTDAPDIAIDSEMVGYVREYIEYVKSFKGDLFVEVRVDYSNYVPGGFGTSDAIVFEDGILHVIDLKYGKGVEVSAVDNTQAMLYAVGALNEFGFLYDIDTITMHIYQPRIGNISECSIRVSDLLKFADYAKERALLALSDNAPLVAGDKQCQWCPHKPNCQALFEHCQEVIGAEFDELPQTDEIEPSRVEYILKNKKLIESWLKAVEENAFEMLMSGDEVKGFKLVEGRSNRRWIDDNNAELVLSELIGDKAYTKKLISPTQAVKALGKDKTKIEDLIEKPPGKPTIAPTSDKRKPFGDVSCEFDAV